MLSTTRRDDIQRSSRSSGLGVESHVLVPSTSAETGARRADGHLREGRSRSAGAARREAGGRGEAHEKARLKRGLAAAILLAFAFAFAASAEPIGVARIIDGDTIELTSGERIRILNVDTPELQGARCNREFALAMRAKERLAELLAAGRPISISRQGRDRYRRALAVVTIGGEDVAALLIREGLALPYRPRQSREKPGPSRPAPSRQRFPSRRDPKARETAMPFPAPPAIAGGPPAVRRPRGCRPGPPWPCGALRGRRHDRALLRPTGTPVPPTAHQFLSMPSRANTSSVVALRVLAFQKGFEVERSTIAGCWRLIGITDGVAATGPNGGAAFTIAEAKAFLAGLPDA
jgi:endonuclease YncB( thermonuclease family)